MRKYSSQIIWIVVGSITLLIRYTTTPSFIEAYYSRGLFISIRKIIGAVSSWLPFPLIYLFFGLLVVWLVFRLIKLDWRAFQTWQGWGLAGLNIGAFLGGVVFFFFFLWGFNYGRIPFTKQLGLTLKPIPVDTLFRKLEQQTTEVLSLRRQLAADQDTTLTVQPLPANLEALARSSVKATLADLGYPNQGMVRGRFLRPKGIFLRFSSAGLYWPFVGEGNIDSGLPHLQQPFTLAHEIAHGYGITNEGVCNFIAYLACQQSGNAYLQYSGKVAYWRYLAIAYQGLQKNKYWEYRNNLPAGFQADLEAINRTLAKYPDIMPRFRNFAYDQYLKSQGIAEGMASYSQIIMLEDAYGKRLMEENK